jgi:LysR family transcriptional regulator, pca operon transcriptional activator
VTRRYLDQRLRLSLLRAVDAVEVHRSLLKASAVLGVTQPALTKSLHELEDIVQTVPPAISETPACMLRGQYRG